MRNTTRGAVCAGLTLARKVIGLGFLLSALSSPLWARGVPEIDPGLATSAAALLGAGLLLIAGRRRQK